MISMIFGRIELVREGWAIFDVNGIGYKVFIGPNLASELRVGEDDKVYTYHQVREDAEALYGFRTVEELDFYELLIGVSGIGPKAAMGILAAAPIEKIRASIVNQDPTLISSVSGIGKKTAEKVVIELKNKVGATASYFEGAGGKAEEVYDALIQLGFKPNEARAALSELPEECKTTEERLKYCLAALNRG